MKAYTAVREYPRKTILRIGTNYRESKRNSNTLRNSYKARKYPRLEVKKLSFLRIAEDELPVKKGIDNAF